MAKSQVTHDEVIGHHGNIVKYYRRNVINQPRGWTQEQLADAMSVSVRWVQEIEKMEYIQDINRRKALSIILSIPTILLNIGRIERLSEHGIISFSPTMLKDLENDIQSRWQTYYSSSNQVTEEGLLEQIEILEQLADSGKGEGKTIACLLSQSYQLAGTLARDNFKYSRAKKYFRDALNFARDSLSPDLISTSLARHALVLLRQERINEAVLMYNEAVDLAKKAQPIVQGYISSRFAEALARQGLRDSCYRTLDFAEKLIKVNNTHLEDDLAFVHLTAQSFQDKRGECYVLCGQPQKGIEYLQITEKLLDQHCSRNHCRLLLLQAEAFLAAREPDTCIAYAIEGLLLARMLGSAGNINWASEIHDKLLASPWKNEPVIGKLGTAIVMK